MTDQELEEIEKRVNASTGGPWLAEKAQKFWRVLRPHHLGGMYPLLGSSAPCLGEEDARFIAHAKQDIPLLIAALRDARAPKYEDIHET